MTSILTDFFRSFASRRQPDIRASSAPLAFDDWVSQLGLGSFTFGQTLVGKEEHIADSFSGIVQGAYKTNGVVFACELARIALFSEAKFKFRRLRQGETGDYFAIPSALKPLEQPAWGMTTGDMLTLALQHADFGGTAFLVRRGDRIRQPRPDWVTMVYGSEDNPAMEAEDIDADLLGIVYHPGGRNSGRKPVTILKEDVGVFAPVRDPIGLRRGIPWVTPVIREIMADGAATNHKLKFFENGATPQMIVGLDLKLDDPKKMREWIEVIEQDHKGATNAYKTLYLATGMKADVVGKDLQQLDFKNTQGAGETRIAAAAGVPAVVVGLSEGLAGSSLNAGNFASSMRKFADMFARPAWRNMAGSLANIIDVPSDAELWYDDRDIPALKDDIKDAAEVISLKATAMRTLADGGWEPDDVVDAVVAGDLKRLIGNHSGLSSVQMQPPSTGDEPPAKPVAVAPAADVVDVPLLASGEPLEVRCTGTRKDGSSCTGLIFKADRPGPYGIETKCHQCGTLVAA